MFPRLITILTLLTFTSTAHAVVLVQKQTSYLTRIEAVELLLRASRELVPYVDETKYNFPDVFGSTEETKYIKYAAKISMIDPEPTKGLIFPYRSVSRAEFLKMMAVAFYLDKGFPHTYSDVDNVQWYKDYVWIAQYYSLFSDATPGGTLKPNTKVTKGAARYALEMFFQKEPYKKPINFSFDELEIFNVTPILNADDIKNSTNPGIVKRAVIKLFQKINPEHPEETRHEVITLVNAERKKAGLSPLTSNLRLRKSAQLHARDMYKRGYFGHTNPEGLDYIDRIQAADYLAINQSKCGCRQVYNLRALIETSRTETSPESVVTQTKVCGCTPRFAVGENIAKGQLTSVEVVEDWMESPGHKANILHPQFEEIGIGLFGDIWVQNFGRVRVE